VGVEGALAGGWDEYPPGFGARSTQASAFNRVHHVGLSTHFVAMAHDLPRSKRDCQRLARGPGSQRIQTAAGMIVMAQTSVQ